MGDARRKGAEIVVWSTQSPQILGAQCRSHEHHYYLLTSTWRNNATLVDPTGAVIAQTTTPSSVLVEQIDLSYVLLDWQAKLENGKALADKYGKAVGFRYSEAEDGGIFWSNDPKIPVMRMVREWAWSCQPTVSSGIAGCRTRPAAARRA